MNQHFFENAPDGAWDDSVFSPLPSEGRPFLAPPSAPARRWPFVAAAVVIMAMAAWWLRGEPAAEPVAVSPVVARVVAPSPQPAPRLTPPTKRKQPAAVATKPAVKNVEVNMARSFGPTP